MSPSTRNPRVPAGMSAMSSTIAEQLPGLVGLLRWDRHRIRRARPRHCGEVARSDHARDAGVLQALLDQVGHGLVPRLLDRDVLAHAGTVAVEGGGVVTRSA